VVSPDWINSLLHHAYLHCFHAFRQLCLRVVWKQPQVLGPWMLKRPKENPIANLRGLWRHQYWQ
jgi:hypothetical protein